MNTLYGLGHTVHLLCAISFIGVVFFEIVLLEGMRKPLGKTTMDAVELALIQRARRIMPWVVGTLFASGLALAWAHRASLAAPQSSTFAWLLWLKIVLALSVGCHFIYALKTASDGCMNSRKFKLLHVSVGSHMLGIVVLAKGMFYI